MVMHMSGLVTPAILIVQDTYDRSTIVKLRCCIITAEDYERLRLRCGLAFIVFDKDARCPVIA